MDDDNERNLPAPPFTEYDMQVLELALLGVNEQEIAAALELDMSLDELRSWAARLREALQRIEPGEIPPVPREHLAILEPLTERELLRCVREANMKRPILLAVDQPRGEGATLRVAPELPDPVGPLEVGEHEDVGSSSARGARPSASRRSRSRRSSWSGPIARGYVRRPTHSWTVLLRRLAARRA